MNSRFGHLREEALIRRKAGNSIRSIEIALGIPRSTLSGWFKEVSLSKKQRLKLEDNWRKGLIVARKKASAWHQDQKRVRLEVIHRHAGDFLNRIDNDDISSLELALAFLYLGEGAKSNHTALGSSDPRIARFFVKAVQTLYEVPPEKFRCSLHLRADQDPEKQRIFWAEELGLPISNFGKASIDTRTMGRPTYPGYPGVCLISCGKVEIQRRLMYIADGFCKRF